MNELTIQSTAKQRRLLEWTQRVAACRSSGLSVKRWCAENDIQLKTYYNWQNKVFAAMIEEQQLQMMKPGGSEPTFVELPSLTPEPTANNRLAASIRVGKATLDVYAGASPEIVTALCQVLSHAK